MADDPSSTSPTPETPPPHTTGGGFRWEPPTAADLQAMMPGYTIEKILGRGGMGAVYKAVQKSLGREVAIKVLPPTADDGGMRFAERFLAEANAQARRQHLDSVLMPAKLPQQSSDAVLPQPGMKAAQTVVASQPSINAAQSAAGPQSRPMPRPVGGPRQSYAPPPKSKAPLFLGIVAMAVIAAGASALPPELAALDTQFIKLQAERVTAPFEADLAKLNAGYLGGIAKKIAEEKAAGHLDGILALEAEQKLITDKQPLPDTDEEKTPATLTALRGIYRTAYAKLAATRATNLKALLAPLDARLATMETDFAKSDRLADAKTVRGYREVLKESAPEVPSGAAQQLASATATPGAATPPQAD